MNRTLWERADDLHLTQKNVVTLIWAFRVGPFVEGPHLFKHRWASNRFFLLLLQKLDSCLLLFNVLGHLLQLELFVVVVSPNVWLWVPLPLAVALRRIQGWKFFFYALILKFWYISNIHVSFKILLTDIMREGNFSHLREHNLGFVMTITFRVSVASKLEAGPFVFRIWTWKRQIPILCKYGCLKRSFFEGKCKMVYYFYVFYNFLVTTNKQWLLNFLYCLQIVIVLLTIWSKNQNHLHWLQMK